MQEYRVVWQQCPFIVHDPRVLFVEAATAEDAKTLAKNYIERKFGLSWFDIHSVKETEPMPIGYVKEGF